MSTARWPAWQIVMVGFYLGVLLVLLGFGASGGGLDRAADPAEEQAPLAGARDGDLQPDRRAPRWVPIDRVRRAQVGLQWN
jgi:hypothetical protein